MLQDGVMSFALLGGEWVLWLLVALSIISLTVVVERVVYLVLNATDQARLQALLSGFHSTQDLDALAQGLEQLTGYEARILSAGARAAAGGSDAAEKAMVGVATHERLNMERGLSILATVGSNAPFIGLFGTVLGVIQAFSDLAAATGGSAGGEANEAVMAGISEALVATAVGLMVAIPAVVLYNSFRGAVKRRMGRTDGSADLMLSTLKGARAAHGK